MSLRDFQNRHPYWWTFICVSAISFPQWFQSVWGLFSADPPIPIIRDWLKTVDTTLPAFSAYWVTVPLGIGMFLWLILELRLLRLGQVHEYLGKDADFDRLPFRVVGAVTTTSTAAVDLFRVSPVNPISPMTPFFVVARFTKTNSDGISLGLKLNKILIGPTHITTEQKIGTVTWFIGTQRMSLKWKSRKQSHQTDLLDERPVAPIYDIAFQGSADSGT